MSDQCTHCTLKGNIHDCLQTDCSQHDSWMVKQLRNEYDKELIRWVKKHHWDSLEKDKYDILRHLRTFTGDKEIYKKKGESHENFQSNIAKTS